MSEESKTRKMSAAAFFNENRAIAGFGNSMRAVFTSVRELVENGLDAAEKLGINPEISIELRKLSSKEINELLDVTRYKKLEKHLDFLQLTCRDNGVGVPGHQIPNLFGRVLTGTKYGVIQTRGRFGLGAKMCLLYSMSSVDLPARIRSRYFMDEITNEIHLMINLEKNEPIVMEEHEYLPGDPRYLEESGTEISVTFTGAWNLAKNSVKEYFKQLAIITPYASFNVKLPGDEDGVYETLSFQKVVDDMPPPPKTIQLHPFGCDITQFKAKIAATTAENLVDFLSSDFMGVRREVAEEFFQILEIDPNKKPSELSSKEIRRIVHEGFIKAYQEAKDIKRKRDRIFRFDSPKGDALSPLGAARLRKGLEKELEPVFVEAVSRPPKAYSGHPFIVEAAIGYGGGVTKYAQSKGGTITDNKIIYRYANRIPLIFGAGNDVITKVVSSLNWSEYGLTRQSDPLAIAVSIVSTKIPFPETSKEYISSVPEIEEEIRLALQQLGRRLKTFLSRAKRRKREHVRLSRFVRSAPIVVDNLTRILENENIPFLNFENEKNKIAAALAHGVKKKIQGFISPGEPLFQLNVWCPEKYKKKLLEHKIDTVGKFLIIPNSKLSTILDLDESIVSKIKQRTILELDKSELSPSLPLKILTIKQVEKRFSHREGKKLTFSEALYQRWIQNSYHYLATETQQLKLVTELVERLFENKKYDLLKQALNHYSADDSSSIQSSQPGVKQIGLQILDKMQSIKDLKEEYLYPSFSFMVSKFKQLNLQYNIVEEFLFKTIEPFEINYDRKLTIFLIDHIKSVFSELISKFEDFKTTNITKMDPDWIDGYTKNAFHRRKIETVVDFISKPTEELAEIKELERSLYRSYFDILAKHEKSISLEQLSLVIEPQLEQKEKEVKSSLAKINIVTIAQLFNIKPRMIRGSEYKAFVDLLLEESKLKIINHLEEKNVDCDISHIKIIDERTEQKFSEKKIFTSTSFLLTPTPELRKMNLPKKDISYIKSKIGTPFLSFLQTSKLSSKYGIYTIEDVFFHSPEDYELVEEKDIQKFVADFNVLRLPLIYALPSLRSRSHLLNEIGINCIGRFLFSDKGEIASVLELSKEKLESLKDSISPQEAEKNKKNHSMNLKYLSSLFPRLVKYFGKDNLTIQELYYIYIDEEVPQLSDFWKKIKKIQTLFEEDILSLTTLISSRSKAKKLFDILLKLKGRNIKTIGDFFDFKPAIVENEITKTSEKNLILELYSMIKNGEIEEKDEFSKTLLLLNEFVDFHSFLDLPVTRLSGLSLQDIEKLTSNGIIAIHQFFEYTENELASILGWSTSKVKNTLEKLEIQIEAQPFYEKVSKTKYQAVISFDFENSERFSPEEIKSLIYSGYDSVDQLFYLTNPHTFGAPAIKWGAIEKFKKLLRSPLTLVTWERKRIKKVINEETKSEEEIEEIEVHSLSHTQLNSLRKAGIRRIIDLFLVEPQQIAAILKISVEEAKQYLMNMRISETGIDLSELDIFKPEIVELLETVNVFTIEDLYFSTQEEKWTLPELPWQIVQDLKNVLNLSFKHLSDMLDPDIISVLKTAKVSTLLGFLLTSTKVLMERTGIPDERFENIKRGLDLGEIFYFFTLPVYFLPGLSFEQTEKLRENGIVSIIDFVSSPTTKLTRILDFETSAVKAIIDDLNSQRIREEHEGRAIYAYETKLFDRIEQKVLSKESIFSYEGFQSIQELYYSPNEVFLNKDTIIWRKILTVKKILSLPLRIFQEISDYSLSVFKNYNITHLYQLLFILDTDLTDRLLFRAVSDYSSKLIDMRAFHYFDFLTAKAYNANYFGSVVQNLDELTLLDAVTDENVINDLNTIDRQLLFERCNITLIRSILELPIVKTSFLNNIPEEFREEYSSIKIGDLFDLELEEGSALQPIKQKMFE
ncbi:MAG: DNA topoisomerase VI subunit B, partial [Candidatus Heimdallarchaeaceae archaeon]